MHVLQAKKIVRIKNHAYCHQRRFWQCHHLQPRYKRSSCGSIPIAISHPYVKIHRLLARPKSLANSRANKMTPRQKKIMHVIVENVCIVGRF